MYFDYNSVSKKQTDFETVTCFWALWSGVASPHQAAQLVSRALPRFECLGGLCSTTENSAYRDGDVKTQRQWDYPFGWAPHQIMAWDGLQKYGYDVEAKRLIYRWLYTITKVFVDFNGTVVEKYDVTAAHAAHKVEAEYGNQGTSFKGIPMEGYVSLSFGSVSLIR